MSLQKQNYMNVLTELVFVQKISDLSIILTNLLIIFVVKKTKHLIILNQ